MWVGGGNNIWEEFVNIDCKQYTKMKGTRAINETVMKMASPWSNGLQTSLADHSDFTEYLEISERIDR